MAVTTRIEPLDRSVELMVSELLSPEAQGRQIATLTRSILAEAQDVNRQAFGAVPPHETTVDGRANAPLETVRPDGGSIVFAFSLPFDIVPWVYAELVRRSPVGPPPAPAYRENHKLFVDGVEASPVADVPAGREWVFLNPVPYARKIELGTMRVRVPGTSKVYQQVEQVAKRRFGAVANVKFTYRAIAGGERVPALVITLR